MMTSFTSIMENTTAITVSEANEKTWSTRNTVELHILVKNFLGE
jgi:hypothetical protein